MSEEAVIEIEESETSSDASSSDAQKSVMTEATARESGLSADEIMAGKKHGLILDDKPAKKEVIKKKKEEEDEDDFTEDDGESQDEDDQDKDPKDAAEEDLDPEEEAEIVKGYNDNEKSLYWKAKKERLKRQDAQRESEHTKLKLAAAQREIDLLKNGSKKTDATDDEEETEGADEENNDDRVMTVGEFKKMLADQKKEQGKQNAQAQETISRLERQEATFKADHEDFDEVMDLAKEMMDKKPSLRKMILLAGSDPNENAAEIAYDIGRMHPKYVKGGMRKANSEKEETDPHSKTKVDKAIKNADKRQSSASVSAGGTKRIVSEADLTVEDAAKLEPAAYGKLSQATRERLLRETCL